MLSKIDSHDSKQMKILQILEKNQFNTGSVHQMFQAAEGLAARSHDVTIVSRPDDVLLSRAADSGIGFLPLPMRNEVDARSIRKLYQFIVSERPDVIHVHKGLSHTLALLATWRSPVPAFVVNRGVSFPLTRWNRAKYRTGRVDRVVTVCEAIKSIIVSSGKVEPSRVSVVYAGVDTDLFDPARWPRDVFRSEKGIPADAFLVMQVGVRDWKGWRELTDSFSDVVTTRPESHLALVAYRDRAHRESIEAYATQAGLAGRVHTVEYRNDMPNVLAAADCIVDASWSGTGITGTIREGMCLGKPVVATDCGGNRELVDSDRFGWLVPPKNREALTRALIEIMGDPERSTRVGRAARGRVVERFSMNTRIEALERLYLEIIDGSDRKLTNQRISELTN